MATVLITVLLTTMMMVAAKEGYPSSSGPAARRFKRKLKRACPWTSWCCKQAPTGWQLFQLVFPLLILLAICMPCIGASGHNMFRTTQQKDPPPGGTGSFIKATSSVTAWELGNVDLMGSCKATKSLDPGVSVAEEQLESRSSASCMPRGWAYVEQVLLSTFPSVESAAQIVVQASLSQEWNLSAILDWGSHALNSASLKFLTIANTQKNTGLFVFKPFSTNTQFCTVGFEEAVVPPGSILSIPVVYVPTSIGKAKGMVLVQTSAGGYLVETLGEGIPSPYKLHPLSGLMVVSKAEVQQTFSLYNPFDEQLFVKEAYVWVEASNRFSTCSEPKGEGVLCKRHGSMQRSSSLSRLNVRPMGEWVVASHSLSPIVDLGILVDDGEHVVGTLCIKIYRHSKQLYEILVVPLKTELISLGNDSAKILARTNFLDLGVLIKTEQESVWAMYLVNSGLVPGQVSKAFAPVQDNNISRISFTGELILDLGIKKQVATITFSGFECMAIFACKACWSPGLCDQNKLIIHTDSTIDPVVEVLYGALILHGVNKCAAVDISTGLLEPRMCVATSTGHTYDSSHHQNDFKMPCEERTMVNGSMGIEDVHGPELIQADDIVFSHLPWEHHIHVLSVASQSRLWLNVSNLSGKSERVKVKSNTCQGFTELISVDLIKAAKFSRGDLNLHKGGTTGAIFCLEGAVILGLIFLCPKSVCFWPSLVLGKINFTGIECAPVGLSGCRGLKFWDGSNPPSFKMCAVKQHNHELFRDTGTKFVLIMQDTRFLEVQISVNSPVQMKLANIGNCGSEYCKRHSCHEQATEFIILHQPEGSTETSFEVHRVPLKGILPDLLFPGCHESAPFCRSEKLLLKVFLITLFSVLVMLTKRLRQERHLAMDARLRNSCNYTFFLQSAYSKTGCIKALHRSSNFEHALEKLNSTRSWAKQNDEPHKRKFSDVKAVVAGNFGSIFRWFFDSQATFLNVRVQIAESPCDLNAASREQGKKTLSNEFIVDDKNCGVVMSSIVKPHSHPTSSNEEEVEGTSCTSNASGSIGQKHSEVSVFPSLTRVSTCPMIEGIIEGSPSIISENIRHSSAPQKGSPQKEKKDRGKRRKRRSNIIDLKQESERGGRSGSSSPPSSPASPATPLSDILISPFLRSDSPSKSVKGSTCFSGSQSYTNRNSVSRNSCIQLSNESLSQLDVHADHVYMPSNEVRIHDLHGLGPKANIENSSSKMAEAISMKMSGNGVVMKDGAKDRTGIFVGENWAAVARRAIATSEADQLQGLSNSPSPLRKDGTWIKPVLLPSGNFPRGGRSMQWRPQLLEEKIMPLNDLVSSPSLVSTSLVAPNARAPGSRFAKQCNEKPLVHLPAAAVGQSNMDSSDMSAESRKHTGPKSYDFLYDIWGDHFAEISRGTQTDGSSSYPTLEVDLAQKNSSPSQNPRSLFAASDFMIPIPALVSADSEVAHSSSSTGAGFSIFSCDTIFSPYQLEDAIRSSTSKLVIEH